MLLRVVGQLESFPQAKPHVPVPIHRRFTKIYHSNPLYEFLIMLGPHPQPPTQTRVCQTNLNRTYPSFYHCLRPYHSQPQKPSPQSPLHETPVRHVTTLEDFCVVRRLPLQSREDHYGNR